MRQHYTDEKRREYSRPAVRGPVTWSFVHYRGPHRTTRTAMVNQRNTEFQQSTSPTRSCRQTRPSSWLIIYPGQKRFADREVLVFRHCLHSGFSTCLLCSGPFCTLRGRPKQCGTMEPPCTHSLPSHTGVLVCTLHV